MKKIISITLQIMLLCGSTLIWAQDKPVSTLQTKALEEGKPYVLELNAEWCGFCKLFERETLKDPAVIAYLEQHYMMASVDSEEGEGLFLSDKYKVKGLPALLFFNSEGKLMGKMIGYQDSEEFLYNLNRYKKKYDKKYGSK